MLYDVLDIIKDILAMIGMFILFTIVLFLVIVYGVFPFANNCYRGEKVFEYEDLDGNKGIASTCQYSDANQYAKKGGQGQPICFVGNKTIAVKWYEDKTEYKNCYKIMFEK